MSTSIDIVRRIADELPVGIWVARVPGGELVYANRTFAEIMGMAARDDVAAGGYAAPYGICTRTGEPYPEAKMPFVRALEAQATVVVDDIVIHRHDGGRVYVRATAKPLVDDGVITAIMIAFIDISREVSAELAQKASQSQAQAAQRLAAIGQLAGGVAHDFNNLLAIVRALSELLLRDEADPARRADLRAIDEVAESAAELTRSLQAVAGGARGRVEPVDLDRLVRGLGRLLGRALDRRIAMTVEADSRSLVLGDPSQLEQVLLNLATNARTAMPSGGSLWLRTRTDGERVILEVEDTGPGIPAALRERVFEPYFTTKERGAERGAGLGLATVYGIVSRHGGTVEVADGDQGGALLRLSLPRHGPRTGGASPTPDELEALPRGEGLVLVVDDERRLLAASARALELVGYRVLTASSGEEAVALFRAHAGQVRAVVLDLVMPGKGGREVLAALKAQHPDVRVVLTSGYATAEDAKALVGSGVAAFVAKPWRLVDLANAVAAAVG